MKRNPLCMRSKGSGSRQAQGGLFVGDSLAGGPHGGLAAVNERLVTRVDVCKECGAASRRNE